jgi:hypothetical protein
MHRRNFIKSSALGAGLISSNSLSAISLAHDTAVTLKSTDSPTVYCLLPAHDTPLIADVDILIVGGTSGAVATAAEAARGGASVFLVAPMPYLGEDICGTLRFWAEGIQPATSLAKRIFTSDNPPVPLHVKTVLEDELLLLNIPFLYSSYCVDLLCNNAGDPAGALIANRSGCQAIWAKIVIDATLDATVARTANLLPKSSGGKQRYEYIVVGNAEKTDSLIIETVKMPFPVLYE